MLTGQKRNTIEVPRQGLLDYFTRVDELLIANMALMRELGAVVKLQVGPAGPDLVVQRQRAETGQWVPYDIQTFALDTARVDVKVPGEGDFLHAWTDGDLTDIRIRLSHPSNPLIYVHRRNPIYGFRWWNLYLTHSAQAGKTLDLFIGKEASAYAESQNITVNTGVPSAKAAVFNTALPAAEAAWLAAAIAPTSSPSHIRIYVCVSVAGVFRVARTIGATTLVEDMNAGVSLAAGAGYMFEVPWRTADSVNFRYSVTTGTINRLLVDELT